MHIKHQLDQLAAGLNKTNQLPTGEKVKLTEQEVKGCDIALSQYQDLMEARFYKWYCKAYYQLGAELFARLASEARADGKQPAKLFSYLVRKNLKSQSAGGAPQTGPTNILTEKGLAA